MKKFLSLVLTLFISSFVFAAPPKQNERNIPPNSPHKYQQQMKQDFERLSKELNITDEQKQKINELMQKDLAKKKNLREQIKEKSNAIDEELMKETVNMDAVTGLATEIQKLNAEIAKINIESKLNVRSILSFDQYSRMERARKQMMGAFRQGNFEAQKTARQKKVKK